MKSSLFAFSLITVLLFFNCSGTKQVTGSNEKNSVASKVQAENFPQTTEDEKIYTEVDEAPQFDGGLPSLFNWLANNISFPLKAMEQRVNGRVVALFIVTSTGKIKNVTITQSLSRECDAEVVNKLKKMPDWIPGKLNGRPVSTWYSLPVSFRMR
ncbi:MAG: energy transducer TonB [Dysgonamonadaceae bacterium]|jgi:protein TonB|nr:energy transducer TonB [Dysgonamonadaceae bacterium]